MPHAVKVEASLDELGAVHIYVVRRHANDRTVLIMKPLADDVHISLVRIVHPI